jgi:hypothetical protein
MAELFTSKVRHIRLGVFDTEEEAARAYDEAALQHRGSSAFLNRDIEIHTKPVIDGPIARVPLAGGGHFQIDAEDVDSASQYYWHGSQWLSGRRLGEDISLHALLLGPLSPDQGVIHLNGDPLDFRRQNLAIVPLNVRSARNRKTSKVRSSIYKGVRRTASKRWEARLTYDYLGTYDTQEKAALAYDEAARRKYGILAAFNFPRPGEVSCLAGHRSPLEAAA